MKFLLGLVISFFLVACGGGGDGGSTETVALQTPPPPPATKTSTVVGVQLYDRQANGSVAKITMEDKGNIEVFQDPNSNQSQVMVKSAKNGEHNVVIDGENGGVTSQTAGGNKLTVALNGPERIDYKNFNSAGGYVAGFALFRENGKFYVGRIVGAPIFDGQLSASTNSGNESVALFTDARAGLTEVKELTTAQLEKIGLAQKTSALDLFLPKAHASNHAWDDLRGQGRDYARILAGVALVGVGVAAVAETVVFGTPLVIAGATVGAGYGAMLIATGACTLTQCLNRARDALRGQYDSIRGNINNQIDTVLDVSGFFGTANPNVQAQATTSSSLIPTWVKFLGTIPRANAAVTGVAVNSTGTATNVTGTVGADGTTNVQGTNYTMIGTYDPASRKYNGTINGNPASGESAVFGKCQTQQSSGGQGTFAKIYSMGDAKRSNFTYEAFNIPDRFQVTVGQTLAGNTGLISGGGTIALDLTNSRMVTVLVSAPQSGTAWNYSLSCN